MKIGFILFFLLGICAFGGDRLRFGRDQLTVATNYEEFAVHGLRADVTYREGKVIAIGVESVDPAKKLPEWMQALYIAENTALTGRDTGYPKYLFDMTKPNRVSAFFGWTQEKKDLILIIGPVLRASDPFKEGQYLAICVNDIIEWRGHKREKQNAPLK